MQLTRPLHEGQNPKNTCFVKEIKFFFEQKNVSKKVGFSEKKFADRLTNPTGVISWNLSGLAVNHSENEIFLKKKGSGFVSNLIQSLLKGKPKGSGFTLLYWKFKFLFMVQNFVNKKVFVLQKRNAEDRISVSGFQNTQ